MENPTVIQNRLLEEIANGNGQTAEMVLGKLDQLDLLGRNSARYSTAIFELFDSVMIGITKADDESYEKILILGNNLVKRTNELGAEVYEELFMTLTSASGVDLEASLALMQAGGKIVRIMEGTDKFKGMNVENFMATVKDVLLYMSKKKTPEIRQVAISILANFEGADIKKNLDKMLMGPDMWIRDEAEEAIAVVRAREDLKTAKRHERDFQEKYPYDGHPKKFFIFGVYDSMKLLMTQANERKIENTSEVASSVRHLIKLHDSYDKWKDEIFSDNLEEADTLKFDIQNTLLHVVKRAANRRLAKESAESLAAHTDDRVKDILDKILKRKESGHNYVGFYVAPKPSVSAKRMPPSAPKKKVASA